jgi:hypothetical protein
MDRAITQIERASLNWLMAREALRVGGEDCMDMYIAADCALLTAFTADWPHAHPHHVRIAFETYQTSLLNTQEPQPILIPINTQDLLLS